MKEDSYKMKILHTADLHLGVTLKLLKGRNIEEKRREDLRRNLNYVFTRAIEEKVDMVLISGDVFHKVNPNSDEFVYFGEQLGRLTSRGIKVVVIAGNHDKPRVRGKLHPLNALIKANAPNFYFTQFTPKEPLIIDIKNKKVAIVPLPYIDPNAAGELKKPYEKIIRERIKIMLDHPKTSEADYKILMAHLTVSTAKRKEISVLYLNDPPVQPDDLLKDEFDYVALGHIHENQKLSENMWYSGSIEKLDFSEINEEKYYNLVTLGSSELVVEKKNIPTRTMLKLSYTELSNSFDPVGELIDYLKSIKGLRDSLLKLEIRGQDNAVESLKTRIFELENVLLDQFGVLGYTIELKRKGVSADLLKTSEDIRKNLTDIVIDYIKELGLEEKLEKRVIDYAVKIMREGS